jgi:hypothetical protein
MLLAKINPSVTKTYQINAFSSETVTAEYMSVKAESYIIGNPDVKFNLRFGNLLNDSITGKQSYDVILNDKLTLTTEELSTWGVDDSILLEIIATKLGTTITKQVNVDLHYTY